MDAKERRRGPTGRAIVLLALGVVVGVTMMATPATAHVGGTVAHLVGHLKNFFYTKTQANNRFERPVIQAGQTVRGTIGNEETVVGGIEVVANSSLPRAAPFTLDDDHVTINGSAEDTSRCNGTVSNPTATAGWVCIYPYYTSNIEALEGYVWGSGDNQVKWGFQASGFAIASDISGFFATWAYKAPASQPPRALRESSCSGEGRGGC